MANASDKARFHLEQTVPELREWERREIFTKPEITSITSQRTNFETLLASREATPALCLRYYTHERNITSLLNKRLTRMHLSSQISQRQRQARTKHLFSILERATRRHHGDLGLWSQYLQFCEEQGSSKRIQRVVAEVVRLFPTRREVWEMAANWAERRGDVVAMRGFWLRGCRFCTKDWRMRVGFAKAELRWVSKSRKSLGIQGMNPEGSEEERQQLENEEKDADMITLPTDAETTTGAEGPLVTTGAAVSVDAFPTFSTTPAMNGAIPKAVFDSAMKDSGNNEVVAQQFFDMFAEFASAPSTSQILQHVVDTTSSACPASAVSKSLQCRRPLIGIATDDPSFPDALRAALKQVKAATAQCANPEQRAALADKLLEWMEPLALDERLVPELRQVLSASLKRIKRDKLA